MPGILPPPGSTFYYNYTENYTTGRFNGANGKPLVPGFQANVFAEAGRIFHTWDERLGPFMVTTGISQAFFYTHVEADGRREVSGGPGDLVIDAPYIGYVSPTHNFFSFAGLDFTFPTGSHSSGHLASQGLNYYTISPTMGLTYFVTPKLEISGLLYFEFHTTNHTTHYHSGDTVNVDYAINYHNAFGSLPGIGVGVGGYFLQQFSDDTLNGTIFLNGFRGRVFAIGPQIIYQLGMGGITAKWLHEFSVQNRSAGDRFLVQFALPLRL